MFAEFLAWSFSGTELVAGIFFSELAERKKKSFLIFYIFAWGPGW